MPRPRNTHERGRISLVLNAGVVEAFNTATEEPLRDRPKHGQRSAIVEGLLRQWLTDNGYAELLAKKIKESER